MTIKEFFIKHPLYELIPPPSDKDDIEKALYVLSIINDDSTFDMFCVECEEHSIFKQDRERYYGTYSVINGRNVPEVKDRDFYIQASCSRNTKHKAMILLQHRHFHLRKIGQYPPLADILTPDLKKYKSVIGEDRVKEWSRAVGLTSHGIGAGSFVYLRRVLEFLIEDAHVQAKSNNGWDEELYVKSRYAERIFLLSSYLPASMVKNKNTYSILSKGVHELDENTCLQYFPVLNSVIELIAEEKMTVIEIAKRQKATQDAIAKIAGDVK